jgi:hypothetical protein
MVWKGKSANGAVGKLTLHVEFMSTMRLRMDEMIVD